MSRITNEDNSRNESYMGVTLTYMYITNSNRKY